MRVEAPALIAGTVEFQLSKGRAQLVGYQITAQPGSLVTLKLIPVNWDISVSLNISAFMRLCKAGEHLNGLICEICSYGYFSLSPDMECTRCPFTAECLGNFTLVPKAGYWRSSNLTTNILPCPNADACIGSPSLSNVSLTGACAQGYYGNLCNGCALNYFRSDDNVCSLCPSAETNQILLVTFCFLLMLIAVLLIFSSIRSATRPKSQLSIYMKVLMNYLQLVIACTSVNLNYPRELLDLSLAQRRVGNVDNQIFAIDCFFDDPDSIASIQKKLIVIAVAPVLVAVLAIFMWGNVKIIRSKTTKVFCKSVASVIILFFLLHPTITRYSFSQFDCRTIDPGEQWLVSNLNIRCWQDTHQAVALTLALPCIIMWVIGLPAFTLLYLTAHKGKLDLVESKLKFGFLVNGYERQAYYWEFVILYRKVLVVCFAVFLSTDIQALSLMIVLVIAFVLQKKRQPYTTKQLNTLESRGILVSAVTIYCGMYFISEDISSGVVIGLLTIVIIANVYFLMSWGLLISGTTLLLLVGRWRRLRLCMQRIRLLAGLMSHLERESGVANAVVPLSPCMLDETMSPGQIPPHSSLDLSARDK